MILDSKDCSRCGNGTTVIDSRPISLRDLQAVHRRRRCPNCRVTFGTVEIPADLFNALEVEEFLHEAQGGETVNEKLDRVIETLRSLKE